jgi:hypothetical protein
MENGMLGVGEGAKFIKMNSRDAMCVWILKSKCWDGMKKGRKVYSRAVWRAPVGR